MIDFENLPRYLNIIKNAFRASMKNLNYSITSILMNF